jgi:hypothetical protein
MNSIYIEERNLADIGMLSHDIAHHLYVRQLQGRAVVIAEEPFLLLRVVRKQWLKLARLVQRERARTLDAVRIAELTRENQVMNEHQFVTASPIEVPNADVYFLSAAQIDEVLPDCHTIYITCSLDAATVELLKDRLLKGGLLVLYKK